MRQPDRQGPAVSLDDRDQGGIAGDPSRRLRAQRGAVIELAVPVGAVARENGGIRVHDELIAVAACAPGQPGCERGVGDGDERVGVAAAGLGLVGLADAVGRIVPVRRFRGNVGFSLRAFVLAELVAAGLERA